MRTETEYWKKIENLVNRAALIIVHLDKIGKRSLHEAYYRALQVHLNRLYAPLKGFLEGAEQFIKLNRTVRGHIREVEERVHQQENTKYLDVYSRYSSVIHEEKRRQGYVVTTQPSGDEMYSFRVVELFIRKVIESQKTEYQKTEEMYYFLRKVKYDALVKLSRDFNNWVFSSEEIKIEFAMYFKKLVDVVIEILKLLKREKRSEQYIIRDFEDILATLGSILKTKRVTPGSTSDLLERLEREAERL